VAAVVADQVKEIKMVEVVLVVQELLSFAGHKLGTFK
jgi:hypothetical protein